MPANPRSFCDESIQVRRFRGNVRLQGHGEQRVDQCYNAHGVAPHRYGVSFNPQITLKSLSYFDDGDLHSLPEESKIRLVTAARDVDLDQLPVLSQLIRDETQEFGLDL